MNIKLKNKHLFPIIQASIVYLSLKNTQNYKTMNFRNIKLFTSSRIETKSILNSIKILLNRRFTEQQYKETLIKRNTNRAIPINIYKECLNAINIYHGVLFNKKLELTKYLS